MLALFQPNCLIRVVCIEKVQLKYVSLLSKLCNSNACVRWRNHANVFICINVSRFAKREIQGSYLVVSFLKTLMMFFLTFNTNSLFFHNP